MNKEENVGIETKDIIIIEELYDCGEGDIPWISPDTFIYLL